MNQADPGLPTVNDIHVALKSTTTAEQCLELAAAAEKAGDVELSRTCLHRALGLNRGAQAAYLNLAALSVDESDAISAFSFIEEAARVAPLPAEVEPLREQLFNSVRDVSQMEHYLRAIGRMPLASAAKPMSIVVLSSRFNSTQDGMGQLEELVRGLQERGHIVRALTGITEGQAGDNEAHVLRTLRLGGSNDRQAARDNATRMRTAVTKSQADLVLAAEMGGLSIDVLQPALERKIPVLHWMTQARPAFPAESQPRDGHYWIAPASDWIGTALRNAGYETARMDTLYPGVRIDRHFRLFLPDTERLRICFAAALRPSNGPETLIRALGAVHVAGGDFTAEFAGDAADVEYQARLKSLTIELGIEDRVRFVIDPIERSDVYARHNVLVTAQQLPVALSGPQLEAMTAGVVVVSSNAGEAKEIVRDDIDGLLFRAGDANDLARQLLVLAREPETFARLQRAAQVRAACFSVQNRVERIEALAADMQAAIAATQIEDVPFLV